MPELDQLAADVGVSGRTLRRAAERQTIRVTRSSPRVISVPAHEHEYVRRHWALLERALQVLRTRTDVRLAVLFGSAARGDERPGSDVDILIRLRGGWRERAEAAVALENALGRPVQLVDLDLALPRLLADVLRDGRVLADRDGEWARLKRRSGFIARAARAEDANLERAARETLERFDELVAS
jgi:predicted nucleotidyltransferase